MAFWEAMCNMPPSKRDCQAWVTPCRARSHDVCELPVTCFEGVSKANEWIHSKSKLERSSSLLITFCFGRWDHSSGCLGGL